MPDPKKIELDGTTRAEIGKVAEQHPELAGTFRGFLRAAGHTGAQVRYDVVITAAHIQPIYPSESEEASA